MTDIKPVITTKVVERTLEDGKKTIVKDVEVTETVTMTIHKEQLLARKDHFEAKLAETNVLLSQLND